MRGGAFHGLTIRAALLLGFGLTLGLWLFTGYDITRRFDELEAEAAQVNGRYTRAQELLSTVRTQALLGSVYVRDALLDPDPSTLNRYRAQLEQIDGDVDRALAQYEPVIDNSAERDRIEDFRKEINAFRTTILEVLASDRRRWPTEAQNLLRQRIRPKREAVIRLSEDVQALNRRSYVQQQTSLASVYASAEERTWIRLGIALAASLGIALLATLYATYLENWMKQQRERDRQTNEDLQRLSTQLITAQEEERRTIARELHDEVGQVLTALKVELSHARRGLAARGIVTGSLETAQSIADSALHSIRDLSRLLHPSVLDDLGLPAAIEAHVRGFRHRHGLRVDLHVSGMNERLAPEVEATAYRIVQEALTNVARHAHASSCRVSLQRDADTLRLTIEDDGRGFDQDTERRGLGLIGIRERVAQLHGAVTLTRSPEGGARISVDLPARSIETELAHSLT